MFQGLGSSEGVRVSGFWDLVSFLLEWAGGPEDTGIGGYFEAKAYPVIYQMSTRILRARFQVSHIESLIFLCRSWV